MRIIISLISSYFLLMKYINFNNKNQFLIIKFSLSREMKFNNLIQ